jgi:TrmH family RNA methyltransferase
MRSVERLIAAARSDPGLVLVEGFHALKHAIRFGADVLAVVSADPEGLAALAAELAPDINFGAVERVAPALLGARPHHTQVLAVARRPPFDAAAIGPGLAVLLEDPRQLGNVGAVVRVAAAAGAAGVLTTGGRDPWEPAALRGSAGLHFALPVGRATPDDLPRRPLVAVDPGGAPLAALPPDALLAFGTERHGLSDGLRARADARVAIPMRAGVSSLNLATAVAVVLYAGVSSARSGFSQRSIVQTGRIPTDS